jgi:hypothetical protein
VSFEGTAEAELIGEAPAPDPAPQPGFVHTRAFAARDRRHLTIALRATGDKKRDTLRMRRVHGLLNSCPGDDSFSFHVIESSRQYLLEFPSSSTSYYPELMDKLKELLGEGSVSVEPNPRFLVWLNLWNMGGPCDLRFDALSGDSAFSLPDLDDGKWVVFDALIALPSNLPGAS